MPVVKAERIEAHGAGVLRAGSEYAVTYKAALEFGQSTGAVLAHAYEQDDVVAAPERYRRCTAPWPSGDRWTWRCPG